MNLMRANKAINSIQKHINSLMRVSSKYGKSMGAMGTMPWNSAHGSTFARKTAEMMSSDPKAGSMMLDSILNKASGAGMEKRHMERMREVAGRISSELSPQSSLNSINYL